MLDRVQKAQSWTLRLQSVKHLQHASQEVICCAGNDWPSSKSITGFERTLERIDELDEPDEPQDLVQLGHAQRLFWQK